MRAGYYVGNHSFSVETVAPIALGDDEFRADVAYCGICGTDMHVYHGAMDARVGDHRMLEARVYEAGDYEQAMAVVASGAINCKAMITHVKDFEHIGQAFAALANEWAGKGVNVNAIAPGYIRTDNTQALRDDAQRSASLLERIPANRWGEPEDFAGPVVFLASAASDYMHGAILTIDGSWMGR